MSKFTHVKIPHCWKSHVTAQILLMFLSDLLWRRCSSISGSLSGQVFKTLINILTVPSMVQLYSRENLMPISILKHKGTLLSWYFVSLLWWKRSSPFQVCTLYKLGNITFETTNGPFQAAFHFLHVPILVE